LLHPVKSTLVRNGWSDRVTLSIVLLVKVRDDRAALGNASEVTQPLDISIVFSLLYFCTSTGNELTPESPDQKLVLDRLICLMSDIDVPSYVLTKIVAKSIGLDDSVLVFCISISDILGNDIEVMKP
jgi:hypothetical protein